MHALTDYDMDAVERNLRCLKETLGDGLVYSKDKLYETGHRLLTYTDADWVRYLDEHMSVSGYCVFIRNNVVAWSNKK